MLGLALRVAQATDGLVTPAVGAAIEAAGYDRDFDLLPPEREPAAQATVTDLGAIALRGCALLRTSPVVLDLNGVVRERPSTTRSNCRAPAGFAPAATSPPPSPSRWACRGREHPAPRGGARDEQHRRPCVARGGALQHHLIDPATGRPARTPWRDVTVAAQHCVAADVAAKAALLLGREAPSWLDRLGLPGRFVDGRGAVQVNRSWRGAAAEAQAA